MFWGVFYILKLLTSALVFVCDEETSFNEVLGFPWRHFRLMLVSLLLGSHTEHISKWHANHI